MPYENYDTEIKTDDELKEAKEMTARIDALMVAYEHAETLMKNAFLELKKIAEKLEKGKVIDDVAAGVTIARGADQDKSSASKGIEEKSADDIVAAEEERLQGASQNEGRINKRVKVLEERLKISPDEALALAIEEERRDKQRKKYTGSGNIVLDTKSGLVGDKEGMIKKGL